MLVGMEYQTQVTRPLRGTSAAGDGTQPQAVPRAYRGQVMGRCHICRNLAPVELLVALEHWICIECQDRFLGRGVEFVRDMLKGESLDCCGPIARIG